MSKLMPASVRHQGIALYEAGAITEVKQVTSLIEAVIDGTLISFGFDDHLVQCACDFFNQKGYCAHLAALEYYLKNDSAGQRLLQKSQEAEEAEEVNRQQKSFGSEVLNQLVGLFDVPKSRYSLVAEGELKPSVGNVFWTLKIQRRPDKRSYVIRDIAIFLRVIRQSGYYQIGKQYYEQISLVQFDKPSQDLIRFLWRLVPNAVDFDSSFYLPTGGRHLRLSSSYFEEGLTYLEALSSFQYYLESGEPSELSFGQLGDGPDVFRFKVEVDEDILRLYFQHKPFYFALNHSYIVVEDVFYPISVNQAKLLDRLLVLPSYGDGQALQMPLSEKPRLARLLLSLSELGTVEAPKQFTIRDFVPYFEFSYVESGWIRLRMGLDFDRVWVSDEGQLRELPFAIHDQHLEEVYDVCQNFGFLPQFSSQIVVNDPQDLYEFHQQIRPAFEALGHVVVAESLQNRLHETPATVQLDLQGRFLDVAFDFTGISEREVAAAYQALEESQPYFVTESGRVLVFDESIQRVNQALQALRAEVRMTDGLQLSAFSALQLANTLSDVPRVQFSGAFQALVHDLRYPEEFSLNEFALASPLRDYQHFGVQWLAMLAHHGLGGILADDMGLGKTLQAIAFLSHSLKKGEKALILAPSSLIYNWQDEGQKFAPQLDMAVVYGQKADREALIEAGHQITVTSYTAFRQDFETYQKENFQVLILDEAQVMKNDQTKIAACLRQFDVRTCFALSGTPIENHLRELWSIFQIVLPDLLPNKRQFNKLPSKQVAKIIKPFILRRRKEDVLKELPDLIETNLINELTDEQKAIYLAQLQQLQTRLAQASDSDINRQKIEILSAITRLRQICNTPQLFMSDYQGDSGKLASLRQLLTQIREGGHRVLIFSQFRKMLELIAGELEALEMKSYQITGSTKADERQAITKAFNAGSRDAVLISLKAGGVGLNLTGADTVVLVDLWWNPAVENQAVARAYRMGQAQNVECYRLITRGTIEEKIQQLQADKKELIATVLDGNEMKSSLSVDDIREILNLPR